MFGIRQKFKSLIDSTRTKMEEDEPVVDENVEEEEAEDMMKQEE